MTTSRGTATTGPLVGVRVVEFAGIGPGPFCGAQLSDLGATVLRVCRPPTTREPTISDRDLLGRGRRSTIVDLKLPGGQATALRLVERADVALEGFRPGVMERLGLGPAECMARNPQLVYGRITGWGQDGPRSVAAGHDITYFALSGALRGLAGATGQPRPPSNLLGDFGGGGMLLTCGILAALFERQRSGEGQVVDASILDGAAMLTLSLQGMVARGFWDDDRPGTNSLDGGLHYYDVYESADSKYIAVGALEPQFYAELVRGLGLEGEVDLARRADPDLQDHFRAVFASRFATRTRDEWEEAFADTDAGVAPVLSVREAPVHPHNNARATFVAMDGINQIGPVPRFSRTPGAVTRGPVPPGYDTDAVLVE